MNDLSGISTFLARFPAPARPALLASIIELIIGIGFYLITIIQNYFESGTSPMELTFNALGRSLIYWLIFTFFFVLLQAGAALFITKGLRSLKIIGAGTILIIASFCALWLGAVVVMGVVQVIPQLTRGEAIQGDVQLIVVFVPIAVVIGILNLQSFGRTIRLWKKS